MSQLPDKPCVICSKVLKPHEQFGENLQEPLCWTDYSNQQEKEEEARKERIQEIKLELSEKRFDLDNDELDDIEAMDIEIEIGELKQELELLQTFKMPANPVAQIDMFRSKEE